MKWWHVALLMVIVVGGGWVVITQQSKQVSRRQANTGFQNVEPGVIEVVDKQTEKKVRSTTVMGKVVTWDHAKGVLVLTVGGQNEEYIIDPKSATIYVPTRGNKTNQVLMVNSKEGMRWQTAFCEGDSVAVATDANGKITLVDNSGYRQCGFKEE